MLAVLGNSQIDDMARARRELEAEAALEASQSTTVTSLATYIKDRWAEAKKAKLPIEQKMLSMVMQRRGEYDPEKLSAIKNIKSSEVFMMITDTKCRAGKAWVKDILLQQGKRIWDAEPTPVPEVPEYITDQAESSLIKSITDSMMEQAMVTGQPPPPGMVMQQFQQMLPDFNERVRYEVVKKSRNMAREMVKKIDDQLYEGGFYSSLEECVDDIIDLKCGILKGPIFRRSKIKAVQLNERTGLLESKVEDRIIPQYERRSPFRIYPSPESTDIDDGYLFDIIDLTPKSLHELIGLSGFSEPEIRLVLQEHQTGSLSSDWLGIESDVEKALGTESSEPPQTTKKEKIRAAEFHGTVPGKMLLDWGITTIEDTEKEYDACAWLIGSHVIKAMLNYDPLGQKPFSKTSFDKLQDSFWGEGLPDKIKDIQGVCNAMARAIVNNASIASGPQVETNIDRIAPGASKEMWPWKVWEVTDEMMGGQPALRFYQPQMNVDQLMNIYMAFSKLADDHSGVPAYAYGDPNVSGVGNTASGFSMLMTNAARGIRAVVKNIDSDIIASCVTRQYEYNLEYEKVPGLVGDYKIVAKGSAALMQKEQQAMRKTELLAATNNPVDMQIIGLEGRRAFLRDVFQSLDIDTEGIVPEDPLQVTMPMGMQGPGGMQGGIGGGGTPGMGQANLGLQGSPGQIGSAGGNGSGNGGSGSQSSPEVIDVSGAPVSGQDTRQFGNNRMQLM